MNARITTSLTLTALSSLLLSADAIGAKLRVPDQFATIQAAVDTANPGDVIEIEEATYVETVDIVNAVGPVPGPSPKPSRLFRETPSPLARTPRPSAVR